MAYKFRSFFGEFSLRSSFSSISSNNPFASSIESLFKLFSCYFISSLNVLGLECRGLSGRDPAILNSRLIIRGPLLDFMFRVDSQISQSNSSLRPLRALREILFAPIRAFRGHGEREKQNVLSAPIRVIRGQNLPVLR